MTGLGQRMRLWDMSYESGRLGVCYILGYLLSCCYKIVPNSRSPLTVSPMKVTKEAFSSKKYPQSTAVTTIPEGLVSESKWLAD
jgi:hypothetical protein